MNTGEPPVDWRRHRAEELPEPGLSFEGAKEGKARSIAAPGLGLT